MKFTMRWFGTHDPVRLDYMRQVPILTGIVSALSDVPVGEVWTTEKLETLKGHIEAVGLKLMVIESIPVHESIKLGTPERDQYIANYQQSIRNMGAVGIPTLCYNFMPVFDWMRTEMLLTNPDGSTATGYTHSEMLKYDLTKGIEARTAWVSSYTGEQLQSLLTQYAALSEDGLFENLAYFLRAIVPVAEEAGVYLAIHPDDPPWTVFGLPRIVRDLPSIQRILDAVPSPHNGLTFCTGSLGTSLTNDLPEMVRCFAGRINFVHMRNVEVTSEKNFYETSHPFGSVDMQAVMQALVEIGFEGPIRPDHGRMIWGETGIIGYGLYDRSLGIMYLYGLYEGIKRYAR